MKGNACTAVHFTHPHTWKWTSQVSRLPALLLTNGKPAPEKPAVFALAVFRSKIKRPCNLYCHLSVYIVSQCFVFGCVLDIIVAAEMCVSLSLCQPTTRMYNFWCAQEEKACCYQTLCRAASSVLLPPAG